MKGNNFKIYTIYMHICPNNKKYVGMTSRNLNKRFANGKGYSYNKTFYEDIISFGWDNIEHIVLEQCFDLEEAKKKEEFYISEYKTFEPDKGYNLTKGGNNVSLNILKKVVCLNTNQIFNSVKDAGRNLNISPSGISSCCLGYSDYAGNLENDKTHLVWRYYEDYLNLSDNDINNILKNIKTNKIKVVCLNTNEIFNSIKEASKKFNINENNISACCKGELGYSGILKDGTPLVWRYYEDYLGISKGEIKNILKNVTTNLKKVVCLNTGEVFDSIKKASDKYNIDDSTIVKCCRLKLKSAGKDNFNNKLIWRYLEDYKRLNKEEIDYIFKMSNIINIKNKKVKRYNNLDNKKIVCLNTKEVFNSFLEIKTIYNLDKQNLSRCCNEKRSYSGKLEDGTPLVWRYYEDYLKLSDDDINKLLENPKLSERKVICLNTKEVFNSIEQAKKKYISSKISDCCNNTRKSAGKDKDGKPLVWRYYEDYLKLSDDDINNIILNSTKRKKRITGKKVVCLNTKEVFNSIKEACLKYNISDSNNISLCCKGKRKYTSNLKDEKILVWRYYEDYLKLSDDDIENILNMTL